MLGLPPGYAFYNYCQIVSPKKALYISRLSYNEIDPNKGSDEFAKRGKIAPPASSQSLGSLHSF